MEKKVIIGFLVVLSVLLIGNIIFTDFFGDNLNEILIAAIAIYAFSFVQIFLKERKHKQK